MPVVGQYAEVHHRITADEVKDFARISGDHNPLHLDPEYAARTQFGERIVHGAFVASYLSALMANELPGPGTIYLVQHTEFRAAVFFDDTVTVRVTVREVRPSGRITLDNVVRVGDREVITGYAVVLVGADIGEPHSPRVSTGDR